MLILIKYMITIAIVLAIVAVIAIAVIAGIKDDNKK